MILTLAVFPCPFETMVHKRTWQDMEAVVGCSEAPDPSQPFRGKQMSWQTVVTTFVASQRCLVHLLRESSVLQEKVLVVHFSAHGALFWAFLLAEMVQSCFRNPSLQSCRYLWVLYSPSHLQALMNIVPIARIITPLFSVTPILPNLSHQLKSTSSMSLSCVLQECLFMHQMIIYSLSQC